MAERLERIAAQIKPEEPPIEQYRRNSKLDKLTLKKLCYGPNYEYREKVFDLILKNRDLFDHGFLEEHDRPTQRKRSA